MILPLYHQKVRTVYTVRRIQLFFNVLLSIVFFRFLVLTNSCSCRLYCDIYIFLGHRYIDDTSDATTLKTFQGPGYILCPIPTTTTLKTTVNVEMVVTSTSSSSSGVEDTDRSTGSTTPTAMTDRMCASIHIDPSCPTMATCDFDQDVVPFLYHTHNDDDIHVDQPSSNTMMMAIPLICDCIIVTGCPSSCTHNTTAEYNAWRLTENKIVRHDIR